MPYYDVDNEKDEVFLVHESGYREFLGTKSNVWPESKIEVSLEPTNAEIKISVDEIKSDLALLAEAQAEILLKLGGV